jgi:LmbE family N-acetylglucosaminyl deacetylase
MVEFKDAVVLILSPHTDDAELGCGATISKLLAQGNEVHCAVFSACQKSVLPGFPSDILIQEVNEASGILGLKEDHLWLYDYDVRTFNFRRQDILDNLLHLKQNIKPDVVFIPSVNDIHQDHHTIAQEGLRAFKFSNLLSFELPWNNLNFNSSCFSIIDEHHLNQKLKALSAYKSQAHRPYMAESFIRGWAQMRGVQIQQKYAECFEVIRIAF